jgi:acyl carrier protein
MPLSLNEIKNVIEAIDYLVDPLSKRYGRLLNWQNSPDPFWHYGVGLSDTHIFDTGQGLCSFERTDANFVVGIEDIAFSPEQTIERLKQALYVFSGWEYNFTGWNCEHLGRLISTDQPRCYQSGFLWWLCNMSPEGDHKTARQIFQDHLNKISSEKTLDNAMNDTNEAYNLKIFKIVIDKYLNEAVHPTNESCELIESNHDNFIWELATKIYKESGHKVDLVLVRDAVDARIETIKYQLEAQAAKIKYQNSEEKNRIAEESRRASENRNMAIEAHPTSEENPIFLRKITDALGKFGGDEHKARVFVQVRRVISSQLGVDESEVTLDSHLSNHLNADDLDFIELVMALEEEFDIEIPDEEAENYLGSSSISSFLSSGLSSSSWSSGFSSPSSSFSPIGVECIVRNFVELISKKVLA